MAGFAARHLFDRLSLCRPRSLAAACLLACAPAHADGIKGSGLRDHSPALRGTVHDGDGPHTAASFGVSAGATSNAGPTLEEVPSAFTQQSLEFAHSRT